MQKQLMMKTLILLLTVIMATCHLETNILKITDNHKLVADNFICDDGQPAIEFEVNTSYSDDKSMRTLTAEDNIKVKRVELTRRMAQPSKIAIDMALKTNKTYCNHKHAY